MFKVLKKSKLSKARLGLIKTAHGAIETPFFMPDATRGAVKYLSGQELEKLGLKCMVANTLHLFLRPGVKLIKQAGGLHNFINWPGLILSDSGGYQIFSLLHKNQRAGQITDQGAKFKSPVDGSGLELTPEQSIKAQFDLGVDMMVCFDDCPPNDYADGKIKIAVERTIKWAERCAREFKKQIKARRLKRPPLLFAVIQGGHNQALRKYCAQELIKIGFDGYGFGARHIDSGGNFMAGILRRTASLISEDKLRFGLGIGTPEDIIKAIRLGWDMFDCVIPTREGRHGRLYLRKRQTINITNAKFARDFSPINADSRLAELKNYSKAYLHYLFKISEPLAARLASLNNLEFYLKLLSEARELIKKDKL
ncbi:MAG: tRNA guanosine(34) transglycosylase Tgt [bacterium]|nr:tRNA guanosine(34) transglycosylase Tgt [bacterium]